MLDLSLFLMRVALGGFFVLARFRFFYDPSRPQDKWFNKERRNHLEWKMGYCKYPAWTAPYVAIGEVLAGLGVLSGVLFYASALALLGITFFATRCTWREKIMEQSPVDCIDWVSCYLWRVEGLYVLLAFILLALGPGAITVWGIL